MKYFEDANVNVNKYTWNFLSAPRVSLRQETNLGLYTGPVYAWAEDMANGVPQKKFRYYSNGILTKWLPHVF